MLRNPRDELILRAQEPVLEGGAVAKPAIGPKVFNTRPSIARPRGGNRPTTNISVPVGRQLDRRPATETPAAPSILRPGHPFLSDMARGLSNTVDAQGQGLNALAAGFAGSIMGNDERRASEASAAAAAEQTEYERNRDAEQTAYDRSRDVVGDQRNARQEARDARSDEMDNLLTGAQIEKIYADMQEEVRAGRIEVSDIDAIENDLAQIRGDRLAALGDFAEPEDIAAVEEFIHDERARRYRLAMEVSDTGRIDLGDPKDAPGTTSPPPADDAAADATIPPPPEGVTGDGRSPTTPLRNESGDAAAFDAYVRTLPSGAHFIGNNGQHYQVK